MLFKLAWRNIWRNKRRTLITISSILFAVLTAVAMKSIQAGAWDNMVNNFVNYYYGFAQIQTKEYWDDKTINNAFTMQDELLELKKQYPAIESFVERVESFALASNGNKSAGTLVIGTQPDHEDDLTALSSKLVDGEYFEAGDNETLVAEGLAELLSVGVGDTLILLSQGYHGVNAIGQYPVKGLVRFGSPQLNKQMVYLTLKEAQYFYGAQELITSAALKIKDKETALQTVKAVQAKLSDSEFSIKDYRELMPELMQAKELDEAGGVITIAILYIIITFGIFGTILMMIKEREYEFGVMVSIGMKKWLLGASVWLETFILGLLGSLAGILVSIPIVAYFYNNPIEMTGEAAQAYEKFGMEPIFPAAFKWEIFASQALVVVIITSILALYAIVKISKLNPIKAMRG